MSTFKPKLRLDTKDTCFFCLKPRNIQVPVIAIDGDSDEDDDDNPASFSYHCFIRHLNLNLKKIFSSSQIKPLNVLEKAELFVPLCEHCLPLASRLCRLYKELEVIRLHLNSCVQNIHDVMEEAENDVERMESYRRKTALGSPSNIAHVNIVKNLRKETIEKCKKKNGSFPKVILKSAIRNATRKVPDIAAVKTTKTLQVKVFLASEPLPPPPPPVEVPITRKRSLPKGNENAESSPPSKRERQFINSNGDSTSGTGPLKAPSIRRRVLKCSICGGDYYDSFALQKHKQTHTSDNIQDLSFPCQYCDEVFKFYFTQRAHLLKVHPVQVLKSHVPEDTTDEEIKSTLKSLVERNRDPLEDGRSRCLICLKNYGQGLELESHVLVTHFDTILSGLKRAILKRMKNNNNINTAANASKDEGTGANATENEKPSPAPDPGSPPELVLDPMTGLLVKNGTV